MSKKTTPLGKLYKKASKAAEMIKDTDLKMRDVVRYFGRALDAQPDFKGMAEEYTFAKFILEGKAIFKGDTVYHKDNPAPLVVSRKEMDVNDRTIVYMTDGCYYFLSELVYC